MSDRAVTMSLRALRRLSETELRGLRAGLDAIEATETFLIPRLERLRRAAMKEYRVRQQLGLPGQGEYQMAYVTVMECIQMLTWARIETTATLDVGRIERTG